MSATPYSHSRRPEGPPKKGARVRYRDPGGGPIIAYGTVLAADRGDLAVTVKWDIDSRIGIPAYFVTLVPASEIEVIGAL